MVPVLGLHGVCYSWLCDWSSYVNKAVTDLQGYHGTWYWWANVILSFGWIKIVSQSFM